MDVENNISRFGVGINDIYKHPSFISDQFEQEDKYIIFEIGCVDEVYTTTVHKRL